MKKHIIQRVVQASEIDGLNHVNNVVYLEWMQDIAHEHWSILTKDNPHNNNAWVVIRHEIDYKNQAVLDDLITVKTWVGRVSGVKSIRHFEILRENILLVKSQTTFCLIDLKTRKPARITESILNLLKPTK